MNSAIRFFVIFCAVMALIRLIEEFFWAIILVLVIGVVVYFYPKYTHYEQQKKLLDTNIKAQENDILVKQMELKIRLLELESKNNKRNAKTEQIELSNELIKHKIGKYDNNSLSGLQDQIDKLT